MNFGNIKRSTLFCQFLMFNWSGYIYKKFIKEQEKYEWWRILKKICERFTNKKIFKTEQSGNITYDDNKNLIKINYDNV